MNRIICRIKQLFKNGFFHVFGAGTINKAVSLCTSIIVVRILSQEDYGTYGYVINIINMFLLFNGFGTLTGLLQYGCMCGEDRNKKFGIFRYGMKIGISVNLLLMIGICLYALIIPQKIENSSVYLLMAMGIPLFRYVNDSIPIYLRTENENKKYGRIYTLNTTLILVGIIIGSLLFGVSGALVSRYVANAITICIGLSICSDLKKVFCNKNSYIPTKQEKKEFIKYSGTTCFNNAVSQLLYNIDIYVIGIVIGTSVSIASYKVATVIPLGLSFIPTAIITYVYPRFVKHMHDKKWIIFSYKRLVLYLGVFNTALTTIMIILAPTILSIIFGNAYVSSVPCFRVLMVGYWFSSTFRIPAGNVLDMLLQVKINFKISVASGLLNIVLDVLLIYFFQSIGAAIATSSIYIFTAVVANIFLIRYIHRMPVSNENDQRLQPS